MVDYFFKKFSSHKDALHQVGFNWSSGSGEDLFKKIVIYYLALNMGGPFI